METQKKRSSETSKAILYLVVPCFNEEAVLHETAAELKSRLRQLIQTEKISRKSRILFVNDGSKDQTWPIITALHQEDPLFSGLNLSRNRGHQNALFAGLMTAKKYCDISISMDADLQDDIATIDKMIDAYHRGADIVYGVRNNRASDTFFKRFTAEAFYKLMQHLGVDTVYNHADFRLMSRRALNGLAEFKEVNLFLRGIVPLIGFPSAKVYYERHPRFAGQSKYPLKKMISFALQGITSFSEKPMRLITGMGFLVFVVSIFMLLYTLIRHLAGKTVIGWSSLMISLWFIGGLILLSIGIVGEYIAKVYLETKERPRYIIQEFLNDPDTADK